MVHVFHADIRHIARFATLLSIIVAVVVSLGCATSFDRRGVYYKARMGDSIWRIARFYRVDVQELAEYNNLLDPNTVAPGMKLYIPPRDKKRTFKQLPFGTEVAAERAPAKTTKKRWGADEYSKPVRTYRGRFDWPIEGRVGSLFGIRNGRRHDGIDIGASQGTPIHASAAGRVAFAGQMRGYGNLILIRHEDDFFTAYAHNSENKVKQGCVVKKGEMIAKVGRTGRATAPHLHFEIRHGQTARNPLFFLPERPYAMKRNGKAG